LLNRASFTATSPSGPPPAHPPPSSDICATGGLIVRWIDGRETLVAIRPFRAGEVVFTLDHATWRLGHDASTVGDPRGRPVYDPLLARVARAQGANCRADFGVMALIARRRIAAGETLTVESPRTAAGPERPA
jgi:hypothetical protein